MVFALSPADAFKVGDKVSLGNGEEGVVKKFITSPTGFHSYTVEITGGSRDGETVAATAAGMKKRAGRTEPVIVGDRLFNCRVASTIQDQVTGLQGSDPISEDEGLLFKFARPRAATFHMGSVAFPIDLMFVEGGRVAKVIRNASPGSTERWHHPRADAVIEVAAGQAPDPGSVVIAESLQPDTHYKIQFPGEIEDSGAPPDERWKERDTPEHSSPDADGMSNKYWKQQTGYDPLVVEDSVRAPAFRPSAQAISDPASLVVGLITGMGDESRPLDWHRDALNSNLAYAVVTQSDMAEWVSNLGLTGSEATDVLDAITSPEGMQIIGDGVVLSGLAEIANVADDNLILWKQYKELKMKARKEKLRDLIRKASTRWSVDDIGSELESRPLSPNQHPGQAALMLVREALMQFDFPSHLDVSYKGMNRTSGYGQHGLEDGIIKIAAVFSSLSGKKHYIEVPVVVHNSHMVFPEVFQDQAGSMQVMAQSAFDEILKQGNTYTKMQDRLNMFSPNIEPVNPKYEPAVGSGMFGVQADHSPYGRDPAERDRSERPRPGECCELTDDIAVQLRGGSRLVYDAGTKVTVVRDMMGDGYQYLCEFPDGRRAPVHYANLS